MPRTPAFRADRSFAYQLDARDPLAGWRESFHLPWATKEQPAIYFCGNSLGLQPTGVRKILDEELDAWADHAVQGHFAGRRPWYAYHEQLRESGARLVGAQPGEVVMMNSLTVNLHLMMVSFFRPTARRYKILIDWPTFPSDLYAVKSQLQLHGLDPAAALVTAAPAQGAQTLDDDALIELIERTGDEIALVLLSGVNFYTGQLFDLGRITAAARQRGCAVGLDLAHAAGNVPLRLHDWGVDFAVWCNYKYLNSGPGAVAGCFVHARHGERGELPRLAGWWGTEPQTRFEMQLRPDFAAQPGAAGWQLSNPPILALAPVIASLEIFDAVGMPALRAKSERMTAYLLDLLDGLPANHLQPVTPDDPERRGCQVSLRVHEQPERQHQALVDAGVICDFRPPDVVRIAPVPLYNTFDEIWCFTRVLAEALGDKA